MEGSYVGLLGLLYKILPAQTEKDHEVIKLVKVVKMEASSKFKPPSNMCNNHSQEWNGRR